jgi:hypothetical protein
MGVKKAIFTEYLPHTVFEVGVDRAEQIERLFDNLLIVLRLKFGFSIDVHSHGDFNITLYSRNKHGYSDFSMRMDKSEKYEDFIHLDIISCVSLELVTNMKFDYHLGAYTFEANCHEDLVISILNDLVNKI